MQKIKKVIPWTMFLAPALAAAVNIHTNFLTPITNILNTIIPLLMVIATIVFLWGVIQYVISADEEKRKQGRSLMIYGIIGLFVMVAVWGIVAVLESTFVNRANIPRGPGLNPELQESAEMIQV